MFKFQKVRYPKCDIDYGWMLVLESKADVMKYCEQSFKAELPKAWKNLVDVSRHKSHLDNNLSLIITYSSLNDGSKSIFELSVLTMDRLLNDKLECVRKAGKIFVSKTGGYFPQHRDFIVYDECQIEDDRIIFPTYEEKDIRIKQWEGGSHYYAYVGAFQVEWEGESKWDTEELAMENAKSYLYFLNKKQYELKQ